MPRNTIKGYNDRALILSIPGLALQGMGMVTLLAQPQSPQASIYLITGTVSLFMGLWHFALAKQRSPAWCLAAFLSVIGFVVVMRLRSKSDAAALAGRGKDWQVTTSDRPFVIQKPIAGFLNLQGERGKALVESDVSELGLFFSDWRTSEGEVPPCNVLFIYCDIDPSGRIAGTTDSLRGLAMRACSYVTVVATNNDTQAYKKALEPKIDWTSNIVLVLDRKDASFAKFFRRLFETMNNGTSMLMAWVKIAPQFPGQQDPDALACVMLAEAGHVTFANSR